MDFSFHKWHEVRSAIEADVGDVVLEPSPAGYHSEFVVNDKEYNVHFYSPNPWKPRDGGPVICSCSGINFKGEGGYLSSGNVKNPVAVYGQLIKALRKFINIANPECLSFFGAKSDQDVMYDSFYRRFLSKVFTKVDGTHYIRNDVLEEIKRENGERWQTLQILAPRIQINQQAIERYRQERALDRQKRREGGVVPQVPNTPW